MRGHTEFDPATNPPFRDWPAFRAGPKSWKVDPGWRDAFADDQGFRIDRWKSEGRLHVVKSSPFRVVYRVDLDRGTVYIKHFLVPDLRTKLRQWFRRGKGRNECLHALELARLGIPTIRPLAIGERRRWGFLLENYLITLGLDGSRSLQEVYEQDLPDREEPSRGRLRRALAIELGKLTAQLHEAGFVHLDLHPGNFLVRFAADDRPRLYLIDLDAVRYRPGLGWSESMDNLALLDHYFGFRASRTDRYRAFLAYLRARSDPHPWPRLLIARIDRKTRAWADRLWRRWGRRNRGNNKYFQIRSSPMVWAIGVRARGDVDPILALLEDPDRPLEAPGARILKDSRTTFVAEVTLDGLSKGPLIYKRFNVRRWFDPLLSLFRPSRGWASWVAGQHLASRAVSTPANLAYLVRRGPDWLPRPLRWLHSETYLVTKKVEPSVTLQDYLLTHVERASSQERRRLITPLLYRLAQLIADLHGRSLSHRDLKSANILIEGSDGREGGAGRLYLIDLVGARLHRAMAMARRVQNLTRLRISLAEAPGKLRGDELRFLRLYDPGLFRNDFTWKLLWRASAGRGRAKLAQNARRGRPIS
ncbi:MAG: lipopolysaccharide kinase InaA family protein [Isosphaeraceae bacterium]